MDRFRLSFLAHRDFDFCNPIAGGVFDALIARMRLRCGDSVLDVGAGKGELLIRMAERWGVRGVGVDHAALFVEEARRRSESRVPSGVVLHEMDARTFLEAQPTGGYAAVCCIGSTHACGGFRAALESLAPLVTPGGWLVIGEGYWKQVPDEAYLELMGATAEDLMTHEGNLRCAEQCGLSCEWAHTATAVEWDAYEAGYARAIDRYVAAHPEDADAEAMLARIRSWHAGYQRWGRVTLGFALYLLRTHV